MRFKRLKTHPQLDRALYAKTSPYLAVVYGVFCAVALIFPEQFKIGDRALLVPLVCAYLVNLAFTIAMQRIYIPLEFDRLRVGLTLFFQLTFFYRVDPGVSILWMTLLLPFLGQVLNGVTRQESKIRFIIFTAAAMVCFFMHFPSENYSRWLALMTLRGTFILGIAGWALAIRKHDHAQRVALLAAYNKLAQKHKHLIQTQRFAALGEVSTAVAHEINNSMISLVGGVDELADLNIGPHAVVAARHLERMRRALTRIGKIVGQMRSFTRDSTHDRPTYLDMREVTEDAMCLVRNQLSVRRISWELDISEAPMPIMGHSGELCQMIVNLINNARDALEESADLIQRKKIWIKVAISDSRVALSVKDSGPGIDPEVKARIFSPFVTTKPIGKGTGLGLSIVQDIVRRHQGTIRFDSDTQGTIFTIELPLALASDALAA